MKKLDRSLFLTELKTAFPQLRSDLNQEHGLLHLETDVFTRFVQTLIDTGDKDTLVTGAPDRRQLSSEWDREDGQRADPCLSWST